VDHRRELGEFLRSRRARVRPEDIGISTSGRRRVPGLRREELAQLAGVSADYYVRLEQGRAGHPSDSVLDAVARALRLDDAERAHLYDLAQPSRRRRRPPRPERLRPELQRLLDACERFPAYVLGRRMDVLAWNRLAAAVVTDFGSLPPEQRNAAKLVFLDETVRSQAEDWEEIAREAVAHLRLLAGRHPDDGALTELVGELSMKSEDFRRWWARHDVREKTHGVKRLRHPTVGPLTLFYETFALRSDPDQVLVTYVAEPGSPSDTALRLLASMTGSRRAAPVDAARSSPSPRSLPPAVGDVYS
jgi:transcriptional regulator with XRE-family HTH domain